MDKSPKTDTADHADFVLKHRVVGAGILLFFGALVLPWLLGPPSEAKKTVGVLDNATDFSQQEGVQDQTPNSNSIEDELLAAIEAEDDESREQVYISKITPLESQPANVARETFSGADVSAEQKLRKTLDKISESDRSKSVKKPPISTKKPPKAKSPVDTKVAKAKLTPNKVTRGWVVQVGVFTDKKGAEKVVQNLKSKGFKPSTSVVDTNRGKATGTRVWLGPFAQRVDAAKIKNRLTSKTGEAGFIRAYP